MQVIEYLYSQVKAMKFNFSHIFTCTLLCLANAITAQVDSINTSEPEADWAKDLLRAHNYWSKPIPDRSEITNTKDWKWEFIGPDVQPAELNPGGKAIPAYSAGRGNGTGRINYIYIHPTKQERLWACSPTGGLWYTKNGGAKWLTGGTDKLPISGASSVAVNLKKPKQWVVSIGDGDDQFMFSNGLWRTYNNGKTYENINGTNPSTALPFGKNDDTGYISEVVCSPANFNMLFTATSKGFWMCGDASKKAEKKWKRIAEGNFYDIEIIDRNDPELDIIIAAGEKFLISYDGAMNWEQLTLPLIENADQYKFLRLSVEYSPAMPNFVYVGITNSERWESSPQGEAELYLLDLKTKDWKFVRSLRDDMCNLIHTRARAFGVSPTDPNVILVGNVQPLYRSTDGGLSFSKIEKNQMHDDCHHIAFAPDGNTVWATHDGGVSVSYDSGLTFKPMDNGIGAANVFGVSTAQTKETQVIYGGYDVGANMLRNGKWWHVFWGDGFQTITHPEKPEIMFATAQNGQIVGSADGESFEQGKNPNAKTEWHSWIKMHPKVHSTIYCAGAQLKRSNDLGAKWETILDVKKLDNTLANAFKFYLSEDYPNVMYAYIFDEKTRVNPQIWRTKNLLETDPNNIVWEKVGTPHEGWIMNIVVDPASPDRFYVLYNYTETTHKLWYYDGKTYTDVTTNLGSAKCESMVLQRGDNARMYIGSNFGVFTKTKHESEWTLLLGLPGTYISSLDINYTTGKLVVGTFGRGVWQGNLLD